MSQLYVRWIYRISSREGHHSKFPNREIGAQTRLSISDAKPSDRLIRGRLALGSETRREGFLLGTFQHFQDLPMQQVSKKSAVKLETTHETSWNLNISKNMSLTFGGRGSYLPFYSYNLGGWTPPVYYVLKKWTPPVDYNLKKRGPTQTWKFAKKKKKKKKITIKRQVPFFWCFVWPIYSVYFVSIKGQGWTPPVYYNLTRRSL